MKILDETGLKFIATKFKELRDSLTNKVDKVTGKDLSTNDYTNEAKAKVDAIPADPKYTDTVQDLSEYAKKNEIGSKANKTDIKTKLSEMSDDATHRLVTDDEKTTWNGKMNSDQLIVGDTITKEQERKYGYNKLIPSFSAFNNSLEALDRHTKGYVDSKLPDMSKYKQQVILTQAEYNALSSTNKNDASKIYFIKA